MSNREKKSGVRVNGHINTHRSKLDKRRVGVRKRKERREDGALVPPVRVGCRPINDIEKSEKHRG